MATTLTLTLNGAWRLNRPQRAALVERIRQDLAPLVKDAGKSLKILLPMPRAAKRRSASGDLNLNFELGKKPRRRCGVAILGECSSLYIDITAHLELGVCGNDPKTRTKRILSTDRMLGLALGNTSLHELGHFIADLRHVHDRRNYMHTIGLPRNQRTLRTQRGYYTKRMSWTPEQKRKLVNQLRAANYTGDFTTQTR